MPVSSGQTPRFLRAGSWLSPEAGFTLPLMVFLMLLLPEFLLPLSRGEAMYALVPAEMLQAGQWLTPILNGVPYLEKPPLLYWLNLSVFKVLGVSDWGARLPTLAVAMGEVWLTYRLGSLLLSPGAAWLGGFILLSSIGFFYLHLQLFTDHLITLTLIAALFCMLRWLQEPRGLWAYLFHLSMGAGYLAKGMIGVGFPVLIIALFAWRLRQPRLGRLLCHPGGLGLLALVLAPWFVATEIANPGFAWHHFVDEHLLRLLGRRQPGGVSMISLPLFWLFLGIWLLPWTLLLPGALYRYFKEIRLSPEGSLLLIWPVVVLGVFSLSESRIEYYSAPALPPLALVLGWRVARALASPGDRSLPGALLALGLISLGAALSVPVLDWLCTGNRREFLGIFPQVSPVARQVSVSLPPLALLGAWLSRRRPPLALAAYSLLAMVLLGFTFQALIRLGPVRSDQSPGEYVRTQAAAGDLVVMESIEEFELGASLAFYAARPILMAQRHGLPRLLYPPHPRNNYLISASLLRELWAGPRRVFLLVDVSQPLEPFLRDARVGWSRGGKHVLVNGPGGR
jgi:4-amino-4-deoxy-L-arabinose transferase-like glycosyltransferase